MNRKFGVVVLSGGIDSTVALWKAVSIRSRGAILAVSFNYGQKHVKEIEYAKIQCKKAGVEHIIVDMSVMASHLQSALTTSDIEIPDGHYAEDSMKQTVVPNRNSIMLNLAAGIAIGRDAKEVWTGVHAGDHLIYPDCRPEFIAQLTKLLRIANEGFINPHFSIRAPFVHGSKADIVFIGEKLGVDWVYTWSCYKGGGLHCSLCGTCMERRLAFLEEDIFDPTMYAVPLSDYAFLKIAAKEMLSTGIFEKSSVARDLELYDKAIFMELL